MLKDGMFTCLENRMEALKEMQRQRKVRWIGISTTLPHLPTYLKWGVFDVLQIPYSALERKHAEAKARLDRAGMKASPV